MSPSNKNSKQAIVRKPGPEMINGIRLVAHGVPDVNLALSQHAAYIEALKNAGIEQVQVLEADARFPDGCFVEDSFLILPEMVLCLNAGAKSRQNEAETLLPFIPADRPLFNIPMAYTIDGGDILVVNKTIYIGKSSRTTIAAIEYLYGLVVNANYKVYAVDVPSGLHLKTSLTWLTDDIFIMTKPFEQAIKSVHELMKKKMQYYIVNQAESLGANVLPVNDAVIIAANCPNLQAFVAKNFRGKVLEVDISEFNKLDGSLTCLSLLY